jgi:putative FmdB family regulatory protein
MPILEYVCKECMHQFETIVQGSRIPECPTCKSKELERRLSVFAVGGRSVDLAARAPVGPCGACGDPRGPGACAMN